MDGGGMKKRKKRRHRTNSESLLELINQQHWAELTSRGPAGQFSSCPNNPLRTHTNTRTHTQCVLHLLIWKVENQRLIPTCCTLRSAPHQGRKSPPSMWIYHASKSKPVSSQNSPPSPLRSQQCGRAKHYRHVSALHVKSPANWLDAVGSSNRQPVNYRRHERFGFLVCGSVWFHNIFY